MVGPGQGAPMNAADVPVPPSSPRAPNRRRRLSDRISIAFHFACDQGDFEAAGRLLGILEGMVLRPSLTEHSVRRTDVEPLVAALERLWTLRHPADRDQ
jgi:hypothetical protein